MDIKSGMFDKQVTVYEPAEVENTNSGAVTNTWTEHGPIWCYLNDRINNETFDQAKRTDVKQITFDVRYENVPAGINTQWQLSFESQRYQIISCKTADEYGRSNVKRITAEMKL